MFKSISCSNAALAAALVISGSAATQTAALAHEDAAAAPIGFADVVKKVKPAVVTIRVRIDFGPAPSGVRISGGTPLRHFVRRARGTPGDDHAFSGRHLVLTDQGSGFFVSSDGYAVTTAHVVDHARSVEVITDDGTTRPATLVGNDPRSDLALVKVAGDDFPFVKFAGEAPRIGDWVLAVGNPFGLSGTVTAGIVSACRRDLDDGAYDDLIQIDAPVNSGNSGGPTFDMHGDVIGVNTAIVSPSGGSVGIGFAIPAATASRVIVQLRDRGTVTRGSIGVQVQPITADVADSLGLKEARGALVAVLQADGPAARAGIEAGDVIVAVNSKEIDDSRDLGTTISAMSPGAAAMVTVIRSGHRKAFTLTVGAVEQRSADAGRAPSPAPRQTTGRSTANVPELGITVTPRRGGVGVMVSGVDPDGPAADRGVKDGDVIVDAAGRKVTTARDLRDEIDAAHRGGRHFVLLHVQSGSVLQFVAVPDGRG